MATELGSTQISSLLETLPGIANVLRSPVADALLNVIRAAARIGDFQVADADELVKYAVRRGLVGSDEGERVLADVHAAMQKRAEKASDRATARAAAARSRKPKAKHKVAKPVKVKKPARPAKKRR